MRRDPSFATIELDVTNRNAKPQIVCDLVADELQAIGLVTVQWAHLEHCLLIRGFEIASALERPPPREFLNLSFTKRLRAFRTLVGHLDNPERKRWEALADRIANAEGLRHKVIHGLWIWDSAKDDALVAVASRRPPHEFEVSIDLPRLQKLAGQIGELMFELSYPGGLIESLMTATPVRPRARKYGPASKSRTLKVHGPREG